MGSLQNMLSVYFHMKNHYRKLKNVQSRTNTNRKPISAGRMKKGRTKVKEVASIVKEIKERPPTRRNPNEINAGEKSRNSPVPMCLMARRSRSPSAKFQTISYASQTPRDKSLVNCEQHEYLQFSLHITEEIIRNDFYKNEEMIQVLKNHYQANKARLNQDKLLKTVAELCSELNIPMDDNMLLFLEDRGSYSRVCIAAGQSPENSPTPSHCGDHTTHDKQSPHGKEVSPRPIKFMISIGTDAPNLQTKESEDCTGKEQPDISTDENPVEVIKAPIYDIQVIQPPTQLEDLSKAFEFGEETLKAPGVESIAGLEIKDFQVLHDGTSKFQSDKESDLSSSRLTPMSVSDGSKTALQEFGFKFDPTELLKCKNVDQINESSTKNVRKLVVSHYSTSVEPETIETKEFSAQTLHEEDIDTPLAFVNDATTQKSVRFYESENAGNPIAYTPKIIVDHSDMTSSIEAMKVRCQRCNRESEEQTAASSQTSAFLQSTEGQYVLVDCPVLIPKEHTKSMDILANRSINFDTIGKSFHTLNLRVPPPHFLPKSSMPTCKIPDKAPSADLHNSEFYDLTPQKDNLIHPNKFTATTCCSCTATDTNNLLLSNRYDRYKKVNENLSFFYPTIATQVSSMDLLPNESPSAPHRDNYREKERYDKDRFPRHESNHEFKTRARTPDASSMYSQYTAKREKVNLDNYRIDSRQTLHNYPTSHKRHYADDIAADKEISLVRSHNFNKDEDVVNKFDKSDRDRIPYKNSTDSMEKRIISLRHDIEKYSKDDEINQIRSQTTVISLQDSSRPGPGDLLDILKQGNALLPSDMSLPRHKKMSVLRRQP